jgi:hypothetical protein
MLPTEDLFVCAYAPIDDAIASGAIRDPAAAQVGPGVQ